MTKQELYAILDKAESEKRSLTDEERKQLEDFLAEEKREEPAEEPKAEEPAEEPKQEEERAVEEPKAEEPKAEEIKEEERNEAPQTEEKEERKVDTPQEDKKEEEVETRELKNVNRQMKEQKFSLMKAIRSVANGQPLSGVEKAVVDAGMKSARNYGDEVKGQIVLPLETEERAVTYAAEAEDVVATELFDILTPLRAKNVAVQAGARFISGLNSNVQIPVMGAVNATWEEENATTSGNTPTFTHVSLTPKRLSCVVEISRTLLAVDSKGVEDAIREDIVKAINGKLEETIFGVASGTTKQPEGIFYTLGVTSATTANTVSDFSGITNAEADIEDANVTGECVYVMSNKAKAALRNMAKSAKSTQLVMENGEVDGTKAINTSHITGKKYLYGDFSNLIIGAFDTLSILVDPYTLSADNKIRLVCNWHVDAKLARPNALVAKFVA